MDISKELKKCYTMKITIDASQVKKELDEVETQLDRIAEKQKNISNNNLGINITNSTVVINDDNIEKIAREISEKLAEKIERGIQ